jgi:hypothetical protein
MVRRFRRHKLLAAWKRAFTAIVRARGRNALALFATVRGFLGELSAAEAVERLHEQEDCYEADRDVNATSHSVAGYHIANLLEPAICMIILLC